ncbi:hypothetical protein [Erythrobacter sp. MTPC3]|uniref:hypothetical protein n=1 Tax=Erythrobacter sp. MTPC3 TaxID=3056564 RepID=UPI0036F3E5CA
MASRQQMDLAIAKADYDYRMSLVDIACAEIDEATARQAEKLEIAMANSVLDRMEALIEPQSGQET